MMTKLELYMNDTRNQDRIEPGKYNIIYADPPWRYRNYSMGLLAEKGEKWVRGHGLPPYDVMNNSDICGLPIIDIAAKNSILLMWATYPKLEEAFEVIAAWGFEYKTVVFTWVKQNPSGVGFHFGCGFHSRANPEICLLASRGNGLRRVDNSVPNLIITPIEGHSKKPHEARLRIQRLYGNVLRIELFARQRYNGWDAWGNETPNGNDIEF
jgi:N6-adenosine-specific RNA methylase IME4